MTENEIVPSSSRRKFLKVGASVVAGAAIAAATISQVPLASAAAGSPAQVSQTSSALSPSTASSTSSQLTSSQQQTTDLQTELDTMTGFLTLSVNEQSILAAVVEAIIPSDSNGPGAKEAGVIYFIDRQLASDYGKSGNMYMQGPFALTGDTNAITVDGITYSGGTPKQRLTAGTRYQYGLNLREFWRYGLQSLQAYANSAYGGNFETLSPQNQLQALTDLWNNKPTSFNGIVPQDFGFELYFMTWSGFLMDPIHGGNRGMVGWLYTGFSGVNTGNFYGEGYTSQQLMVASTPTRLKPASIAQFQKGSA